MKNNYSRAMKLYIEISESDDGKLISLVRRYINGEDIEPLKVEFAVRELRKRGYKSTITFEKEG